MQVGESLKSAWGTFNERASALCAATAALVVIEVVANAILARTSSWVLSFTLSALLSGLLAGGQMNVARIAASGRDPSWSDAFAPFKARQGDYLLVGLAIGLGSLVCGIGFLVTAFFFMFAPVRVVEGDDFKQALRESKNLVVDNLNDCIALFFTVFALNFLGFITVIGWMATLPITSIMVVRAYDRLRARALPAAEASAAM